ncbi:sensor histidine kinase [Rhodococcus sp. P1Y]|uniref:sensor histidine kinase n=1 Tax=Rhodococcus sp. P1Y TaxID=1302308 RepID=UPI00137AFDAE|nr:histidine kinase [Rhodococcus sp. P1Y]
MPKTVEAWDPRVRRPWFRRIPVLSESAFVVSLMAGAVELAVLVAGSGTPGGYVALAVAMCGVVLARSHPWVGLILVLLGIVVDALFWDPLVMWTIATFTVFTMTLRGMSVIGTGLTTAAVAFGASVYANDAGLFDAAAILGFSVCLAAAATGNAVRSRDLYWNALDDRARDAASARHNEVNRRVAEERVRIARDLHDMMGHEVAVLSMNLGMAEVALPPEADRSRVAIASARVGVQTILEETQSILRVLRGGVEDSPAAEVVPSVWRLETLLASFRGAGLDINDAVSVDPGCLAPAVDVALYRVMQEALTNAHRHGNGSASVHIDTVDNRILMRVSNIRGSESNGGRARDGYGLVGMRERVTSVGGQLRIGTAADEFVVEAEFPSQHGALA